VYSHRDRNLRPTELQLQSVADFLTNTETFDPRVSVAKVIGFMRERKLTEAFVEEEERTGIITLRDLLGVESITSTKASSVMSYVPRLNPNNNVGDAATLMFEYRIRSLPIYNKRKFLGKIDAQALIDKVIDSQDSIKVNRLMTANPITIEEQDDIGKARRIMIRRRIDQLPATRAGKLAGVVSSDSIVYNMLPLANRDSKGDLHSSRSKALVEDYDYPDFAQNDVRDSLRKVFQNMKKAERTYSVITSFDEIQGIITHRDFMRILTNQRPRDGIPMYMIGLPEDPFEAEAAREKFERIVKLIKRENPEIEEARAIIKAGETKSASKRYNVHVFIMSPKQRYSYEASGFELPDIFDEIERWGKRLVSREDKGSRRTRADPGALKSKPDLWVN
jgi:CBS domain-containing protein